MTPEAFCHQANTSHATGAVLTDSGADDGCKSAKLLNSFRVHKKTFTRETDREIENDSNNLAASRYQPIKLSSNRHYHKTPQIINSLMNMLHRLHEVHFRCKTSRNQQKEEYLRRRS